jgi:uncharacterized protein YrzB (UPF0473 family)
VYHFRKALKSNQSSMPPSPAPDHNDSSSAASVILKDEFGRSLVCHIEHSIDIDGKQYLLLLPADAPVEIIAWEDDGEEAEAILIEDDEEIDSVFENAKAVLAEQDLVLKRSAFSLTVTGELPEVDDNEVLTLEIEEDGVALEPEEFQLLASFLYQEQEYAVYTPLDPLLFFARLNSKGEPELLSPEEFKEVQPLLEEQLFEAMD